MAGLKEASTICEKKLHDNLNGKILLSYNFRCDNNANIYYLCSYIPGTKQNIKNSFVRIPKGTNKVDIIDLDFENNGTSNNDIFKRLNETKGAYMIDVFNEISYEFIDNKELLIAGFYHI